MQGRALVICPFFDPGYRAGGPIKSIVGIVDGASAAMEVLVLTQDRDLGCPPYQELSGRTVPRGSARVHYMRTGRRIRSWWRAVQLARHFSPDVIYLNSLWSPWMAIVPAVLIVLRVLSCKMVVVAPRGQLADGALGIHASRKMWILRLWKLWAARVPVLWHATDQVEAGQIARTLGGQPALVSMDPVHLPAEAAPSTALGGTPLRAVFVGRIAPVKGLHLALEALRLVEARVEFRIYGPPEDGDYLRKCRELADMLSPNVTCSFMGELHPNDVRSIFAGCELFLFPTLGENFGHVVAESLSASCPVAACAVTPWSSVLDDGGGRVLADHATETWASVVEEFASYPEEQRRLTHTRAADAYERWHSNRDRSNVLSLALAHLGNSTNHRSEPNDLRSASLALPRLLRPKLRRRTKYATK